MSIGGEIQLVCDGEDLFEELIHRPEPSPFRYECVDGELTEQSCHMLTEPVEIDSRDPAAALALAAELAKEGGWRTLIRVGLSEIVRHLCPACSSTLTRLIAEERLPSKLFEWGERS